MTDYQRGFLEGLQAVCIMGDGVWEKYFKDAENQELPQEDQDAAFSMTAAIGFLVSDVKGLAASVHRGQMDPTLIAKANGTPFWWATEDGKGRN